MPLEKLRTNLQNNKISLADAIVEALPVLRETEEDTTLAWLVNELQGYSNAMDFYSQPNHDLPDYRIVSGSLKLLGKNGDLQNLQHSLANRDKYFISVPISWLEEFSTLPGNLSITEMPELTKTSNSGHIVLQLPREQMLKILNEVKTRLLSLLSVRA